MRHPLPSQIRCRIHKNLQGSTDIGLTGVCWLFILLDNPLPEGEEVDIAMEEEFARQAGRVYLRWDGGNCWNKVRKGTSKISWVLERPSVMHGTGSCGAFFVGPLEGLFRLQWGYEFKIYES
ncbi:hypothetical protein PIB30_039075 [Stylosanthes scabra]|uniref:Uncharacterized protein n=1 Tax=Stylosanthes scabra TaxID=79078 RepID=A0ABU6VG14_9FABA|nr:hypothetical protein [Stylosanthes scabra]